MTPALDDKITDLTVQIAKAFRDVLRGGAISLSEAAVMDDYGGVVARQEARKSDTDEHWWEVSEESLLSDGSNHVYLDDQGFRYYLPAFLTHSLKIFSDPRTGTIDTRGHVLEMLSYSDQSDLDRWARRRERLQLPMKPVSTAVGVNEKQKWAILTPEQNHIVCLYLRFVAACSDETHEAKYAAKGLQQYWGQYCENR